MESSQEALNTTLLYAAERNDALECKRLLDEGADPNAVDGYGEGPLHKAIRAMKRQREAKGRKKAINPASFDSIEVLLSAGANPNMKASMGETPLHIAAKDLANGENILRILGDAGANINIEGTRGIEHGTRPMDVAIGYFNKPFIIELIRRGANIFHSFKDMEDMSKYFGGNLDWVPDDMMRKLERMQKGRSAFGM